MSQNEITFVADAMLGRLARWLRLAGFDTLYDASLDDRQLATLSRLTGRVLLTRDRELAQRRGLDVLMVQSDSVGEQLRQVFAAFPAASLGGRPRCPRCNGELGRLAAAQEERKVPVVVRESGMELRSCLECGQVYWRGSHWRRIVEVLARAGAISLPPEPLL